MNVILKILVRWLPAIALGAGAFILGAWISSQLHDGISDLVEPRVQQRVSLQMLRNEELMMLVTNRMVTQVVVEHEENSALLGTREGYLVATVKLYYGIDLQKLDESAIRHDGTRTIVQVPQPTLLDFAVDPEIKFMSKRSGLQAVKDWMLDKDLEGELRSRIKSHAIEFMQQQGQMPSPEVVLSRLNGMAPLLSPQLQFEYAPQQ